MSGLVVNIRGQYLFKQNIYMKTFFFYFFLLQPNLCSKLNFYNHSLKMTSSYIRIKNAIYISGTNCRNQEDNSSHCAYKEIRCIYQ